MNQLKRYQEAAVNELVLKTRLLGSKKIDKKTIVFQAPTGSGKTFMMSQYITELVRDMKDETFCYLWVSIGKGGLHKQSYKSLKKIFNGFPKCYLLEEEFSGARRTIARNEVIVVNWEKLNNKDSKTGEWKNTLMKDKETTNFRELVVNTRSAGLKLVLIIDESHSTASAKGASEIRDLIGADLTIEMSATPTFVRGEYQEEVVVPPSEVVAEGMIKKEIVINEDIDTIADDEITSQELVMEMAWHKRSELQKMYKAAELDINPLVLVQIPNGDEGTDKRDFVEKFLAQKDITIDNGKLAVWLTDEKVNQEQILITRNDDTAEFLIFKQAVDTGWDCPRAQILAKFRETKSMVFEIQTVGRILRMPEAIHYDNDQLNRAFVFTNVKSFTVKYEGENGLNIIKSVHVKRDDAYMPLKLRSYYRNRVDYGDITSGFKHALADVFCAEFGFSKDDFKPATVSRNSKKFAGAVDVTNLEAREDIILNKVLDTKLFDHISADKITSDSNFQAKLSTEDKERVFWNIIRTNLNGYAQKRSLGLVKNTLYKWFEKYLGVDLYDNGIIYVQNVVLNNAVTFSRLLDSSVRAYAPLKKKEILEKIAETEQWNSEWEVFKERDFNPNTYKPYVLEKSLYKHAQDKKAYLNVDSAIEKEFVDVLESHADKIAWWWQNGNEHMALNFGIKYGEGSTFQPDFLVQFADGRLGIFDTKASGDREDDNRIKAEALQKYIKEENKRKKTDKIFGGLIVKEGEHFRVNSDNVYIPFAASSSVKDVGSKTYSTKGVTQKGWQYFTV